MAIQYQDGSFSETMPFHELMKRFAQEIEEGRPIKALHFGTPWEINAEKEKQAIEDRIEQLEQAVRDLSPIKTTLEIPAPEEVRNITELTTKWQKKT
jgi:hypothetical protein